MKKFGIEAFVRDSDEEEMDYVPRTQTKNLFDIAKKYEEQGDYELALKFYNIIIKMGPGQLDKFFRRYSMSQESTETIYYRAQYSYLLTKIKSGQELSSEDLEKMDNLIKKDKDNLIGLANPGMYSARDFMHDFFGRDISVMELENDILPNIREESEEERGERGQGQDAEQRQYPEELWPQRRWQEMRQRFEIQDGTVRVGKSKMEGWIAFKVKGTDVTVLEKFFDRRGDDIVMSYGAATYIVHDRAEIDIQQVSRGALAARKRQQEQGRELVTSVRHKGDYYERLVRRVNEINSYEEHDSDQPIILPGNDETQQPTMEEQEEQVAMQEADSNPTQEVEQDQKKEEGTIEEQDDQDLDSQIAELERETARKQAEVARLTERQKKIEKLRRLTELNRQLDEQLQELSNGQSQEQRN
ncbi:MAG: hypothetical protein IKP28_03030 [Clostridia bacterium]|nr:hypothetical protein [Clostridia bacterium]